MAQNTTTDGRINIQLLDDDENPLPLPGDRVRADWSDGNGSYDEIVGIVVEIDPKCDLVGIDVDYDEECKGGDAIRYGVHHAALEWIEEVINPRVTDPA